jgi:hypothetical protein
VTMKNLTVCLACSKSKGFMIQKNRIQDDLWWYPLDEYGFGHCSYFSRHGKYWGPRTECPMKLEHEFCRKQRRCFNSMNHARQVAAMYKLKEVKGYSGIMKYLKRK